MQIIETYGKYIEKWANTNPDRARVLLKLGWEVQNLKYKFTPDKRLLPADRYLAHLMMNTMLMPLRNVRSSVSLHHVRSYTKQDYIHIMQKHFPAIFPHQMQNEHFYSRQRTQEFQKHYAAIIRHFWERHRRRSFQSPNVSYTQTLLAMQIY